MTSLVVVALIAVATTFTSSRPAQAHPSGTYTINRYARLELYQHGLVLDYVADYSEIPSLNWAISHDSDGDHVVSQVELDTFLDGEQASLLTALRVAVGADELRLEPISRSASFQRTDLGVETLRYEIVYLAPVTAVGEQELTFSDTNFSRIGGWRAVTVLPTAGTVTSAGEGLLADPSLGLTRYPDEWKSNPPDISRMSFSWNPSSGQPLAPRPSAPTGTSDSDSVVRLDREFSLWGAALGLIVAWLLGFVDALGPGHGKSVVSSYLVGSERASFGDIAAIGLTAAVVHGVVVVLLSSVAMRASQQFLPDAVEWLTLGSGAVVCALGLALVWRGMQRPKPHGGARKHEHGTGQGLAGAIGIGALTALIPCPTGIVLLLSAVATGELAQGVALACAFSAGTASALVGIGLAIVVARKLPGKFTHAGALSSRTLRAFPVLAAGAMVASGVVIVMQAVSGEVL